MDAKSRVGRVEQLRSSFTPIQCPNAAQEEPLCTEYQTHLDLQGLGLTALQAGLF